MLFNQLRQSDSQSPNNNNNNSNNNNNNNNSNNNNYNNNNKPLYHGIPRVHGWALREGFKWASRCEAA